MRDMLGNDDFRVDMERPRAGVVVITVSGDLGLATSLPVREKLTAAAASGLSTVVVDLSKTRSVDIRGVRTFVAAARWCLVGGTHVAIVCAAGSRVDAAMRRVGLDRVMEIHSSREEALRAAA
jgi:anti-anti-sigma factor